MSDPIKHECGIAFIRLLKPLEYYYEKYGTYHYGLNKMYLLMEKQHNRGQDGSGLANIKLDVSPGKKYISIEKSNGENPIKDIFQNIHKELDYDVRNKNDFNAEWLKENSRFSGELFLGHLRYGTFGNNSIDDCHPLLRENNWMSRNLVLAGNFNLTNVKELFQVLLDIGQHPKKTSDTVTILEKIGHFLDEENKLLFRKYKEEGLSIQDISKKIFEKLDIQKILQEACKKWDGGYVIAGMLGHGDSFILRDPSGIRPAFYYHDDEVVVVASERPVIQTAFNVPMDKINEITPANALIVKRNGDVSEKPFTNQLKKQPCSFERIYFSRGTDFDIYEERKMLGKLLSSTILKRINNDLKNTVFSYIPNTAETCYLGMVEELKKGCVKLQKAKYLETKGKLTDKQIDEIFAIYPRVEKIAVKDAKLRTFITNDNQRNELVTHVYDITYGTVKENDTLVVIDDSIVRGTTLKESIIRILDRLNPKKIMIVSSAPQIRYPDCYGIDMAKLQDFIAFVAAIALLKDNNKEYIIDEVYKKAKEQLLLPDEEQVNCVKEIYTSFSDDDISKKIAEILNPGNINAKIDIVYQSIDNLHIACPNHKGDWYFSGNYPTPGGNRVVNQSFVNYKENVNKRSY